MRRLARHRRETVDINAERRQLAGAIGLDQPIANEGLLIFTVLEEDHRRPSEDHPAHRAQDTRSPAIAQHFAVARRDISDHRQHQAAGGKRRIGIDRRRPAQDHFRTQPAQGASKCGIRRESRKQGPTRTGYAHRAMLDTTLGQLLNIAVGVRANHHPPAVRAQRIHQPQARAKDVGGVGGHQTHHATPGNRRNIGR